MTESWWSHRTIGEAVSYGFSLVIALLVYIGHHVRQLKITLNGKNPKKITYEDSGK